MAILFDSSQSSSSYAKRVCVCVCYLQVQKHRKMRKESASWVCTCHVCHTPPPLSSCLHTHTHNSKMKSQPVEGLFVIVYNNMIQFILSHCTDITLVSVLVYIWSTKTVFESLQLYFLFGVTFFNNDECFGK